MPEPALLPVWPDAAQLLGINAKSTAYLLARTGRFPVTVLKVGSRPKVRRSELYEFLGLPLDPPTKAAG